MRLPTSRSANYPLNLDRWQGQSRYPSLVASLIDSHISPQVSRRWLSSNCVEFSHWFTKIDLFLLYVMIRTVTVSLLPKLALWLLPSHWKFNLLLNVKVWFNFDLSFWLYRSKVFRALQLIFMFFVKVF